MQEKLRQLTFLFQRSPHSGTFTFLAVLVIIAAIPLTVFIAQKQQELRQRAAQTCDTVCDGPPTCRPGGETCDGPSTCRPGPEVCDGPSTCRTNPDTVCDGPPTCRPGGETCDGPSTCRPGPDICDGPDGECRPGDDICDGPPQCHQGPDICDGPPTNCHQGPDICDGPPTNCHSSGDICDGPPQCHQGPDICDGPPTNCHQVCTQIPDAPPPPPSDGVTCWVCDCGEKRSQNRSGSCQPGELTSDPGTCPAPNASCGESGGNTGNNCYVCDSSGFWRKRSNTGSCDGLSSGAPSCNLNNPSSRDGCIDRDQNIGDAQDAPCIPQDPSVPTSAPGSPAPTTRPGFPTPTTRPGFPTPIPSPTPTLGPTPTFVPGGMRIAFSLYLQGNSLTENNNPRHRQRNVVVQLFNANNQQVGNDKSGLLLYDQTLGRFTGAIDLGTNIPNGAYSIKVKATKHLRKLILGIHTLSNNSTYTAPSANLTVGDVTNNNTVDILDFNYVVSCFGNRANSTSCPNKDAADLDDNDIIDGIDINYLIRSLGVQTGD